MHPHRTALKNKLLFKNTLRFIIPALLLLSSCNWFKETPEIGLVLADHFKDKLYKNFDTAAYNVVFQKHLDSLAPKFSNPKTLKSFYEAKELQPVLVTQFYAAGGLTDLLEYIGKSSNHGYNPKLFRYTQLKELMETLSANKFKNIEEVYPVIADLELNAAEALIKYNNFMFYGSINPRKLFNRYYIQVKRPDSLGIQKVLSTKNISLLLADVQPKSEHYRALQQRYQFLKQDSGLNNPTAKTLLVNMERLRWKIGELGEEYIEVNIPDFTLTWFNNQDTVTHMRVCVGGKREKDYKQKQALFAKSGKLDDKPKNHETPILMSRFNSIQVNPIWNIPVSIARSEIYWMARKDPYYLSNNNIKVYYKGKLINDPDTIQWNKYQREKLPFQFKQGSGNDNALGKFKFIFENGSSIYLHDTNYKNGFKLANRAISHGCVRVERPLEFAEHMVKDKYQYDDLRMEVNLAPLDTTRMSVFRKKLEKKADTLNVFELKPKWFGVRKQFPILINYKTAWSDHGKIEFRPDVYGLDETLWEAMRKFL